MTNPTDLSGDAPTAGAGHARRSMVGWPTAAIVALLVVVAVAAGVNRSNPTEDHFVDTVRTEHPHLSASAASDAELVAVARRSCGPDGLSTKDGVWLEDLGLDEGAFVRDAQVLCPQR